MVNPKIIDTVKGLIVLLVFCSRMNNANEYNLFQRFSFTLLHSYFADVTDDHSLLTFPKQNGDIYIYERINECFAEKAIFSVGEEDSIFCDITADGEYLLGIGRGLSN